MSYQSGLLNERVGVLRRVERQSAFGHASAGYAFEDVTVLWAGVSWSKGVKSMREGVLDAYDTLLFRFRWSDKLKRDSFLSWDGRVYQIMSFNGSRRRNEIQITAVEMVAG